METTPIKLNPDDRIHLNSRNGIYTVVRQAKYRAYIVVTCAKWANAGPFNNPVHWVIPYADFKCKVGLPRRALR
jgi:hypothetical protein